MKKLARHIFRGCLMLLALLLIVWAGLIVYGEWQFRTSIPKLSAPRFEVSGPSNAPVLILLHGAGLNGRMWDGVRRDIDPAWRVLAPDLPGHGSRSNEIYSPEAARATIAAAARAVAPAPVILVGDSLGGYSALAAASAIPKEQLAGLMLGGSSANFQKAQFVSYAGSLLFVNGLLLVSNEQALGPKLLQRFGVPEADQRALMDSGLNLRAVLTASRSLMGFDARGRLAEIDAPVLIVNGTLDERAVAGEADFVAAAKQASVYHFENCEHGVSMRRAAEFATELNAFAARAFKAGADQP